MTLSQATLLNRIRWHLGDLGWETTGSADSATSDVLVADGGDWSEGDVGVWEEDGDTFYTRDVSGDNVVATRSYYGSTGAAHEAGRIFKNPKYKTLEMTNAISEIIEFALPWPKFYKVTATTITPDAVNKVWYDLAADAYALVRVRQLYGADDRRVYEYGGRHIYNRVGFSRGLPTSLVASGVGVAFPDGFAHTTNTVSIDYATKITDTVTSTLYDDFSAGDAITTAIEYGAVALLQGSLELRKPRHSADETDNLRASSLFERLFQRALATAEKELRQKDKLMKGWDKLQ